MAKEPSARSKTQQVIDNTTGNEIVSDLLLAIIHIILGLICLSCFGYALYQYSLPQVSNFQLIGAACFGLVFGVATLKAGPIIRSIF